MFHSTSGLVSIATMSLAENVRKFRKEAGLSQVKLASQSGLSQQLISQIERGENEGMTDSNLARLASALGKTPFDLSPNMAGVASGSVEAQLLNELRMTTDLRVREDLARAALATIRAAKGASVSSQQAAPTSDDHQEG